MSSFGADRSSLRVSELAHEMGIHKSTASRLLATLERRRFVRRTGERFVPGLEIVRIARLASAEEALAAAAAPALDSLARETGEAALIGIRRGDEAHFLHQAESEHILSVADWTGRSTPLHVSAVGKVLVAFGAPYASPLTRFTPQTITDAEEWERELERVRAGGFAVLVDELEAGLSAVAAPVFDDSGSCVAAGAVPRPTFRFAPSLQELGEPCKGAAREMASRPSWGAGLRPGEEEVREGARAVGDSGAAAP